jgi:hypothetical protein
MKPRPITDADEYYYGAMNPYRMTITGPGETEMDITPCPALVTDDEAGIAIRVAWELDEIELAHLAQGGTLWLTSWGGLPVHELHVQPPHGSVTQ